MDNVKPCPFCGIIPEVAWLPLTSTTQFAVRCQNNRCACFTRAAVLGENPDDACKRWNDAITKSMVGATGPLRMEFVWDSQQCTLKLGGFVDSFFVNREEAVALRNKLTEWIDHVAAPTPPQPPHLQIVKLELPTPKEPTP